MNIDLTDDEVAWTMSALSDKLAETARYIGIETPRIQPHHDSCCEAAARKLEQDRQIHGLLRERHDILMSAYAKFKAVS